METDQTAQMEGVGRMHNVLGQIGSKTLVVMTKVPIGSGSDSSFILTDHSQIC